VAVPARGVAGAAGLLEDLLVENLRLLGGHPLDHPVSLADRREVEGLPVIRGDLLVTLAAERQVIGRALHDAFVGGVLVVGLIVPLVAVQAALLEVLVRLDELPVDEERQVEGLRLDRRRRPRSPLSLALRHNEGLAGLLEHGLVGVAGDAAARLILGGRRRGQDEEQGKKKRSDQGDEPCLHKSSRMVEAVKPLYRHPGNCQPVFCGRRRIPRWRIAGG